jgi:nicotinate phosphoribosyltransferase
MAHHFVLMFGPEHEEDAFEQFLRDYPDRATLLIDTYDTVAGAEKAIRASRASGVRLGGVRVDSGDIARLAREVRSRFDAAGMQHVLIVASGDLDEFRIETLLAEGAPIDAFGVGTMMVTSYDAPALGGVFKLVAQERAGVAMQVMKLSPDKITEPGVHQVFRGESGDIIGLDGEAVPGRRLLERVMTAGRTLRQPALDDIRAHARREVASLPAAVRRLTEPEAWQVTRSDGLRALRRRLGAPA